MDQVRLDTESLICDLTASEWCKVNLNYQLAYAVIYSLRLGKSLVRQLLENFVLGQASD